MSKVVSRNVTFRNRQITASLPSALDRTMRLRRCAPELLMCIAAIALYPGVLHAQTPVAATGAAVSAPAPATGTPITLEEAIRRAQVSDVTYRTAAANKSIAGLDKSIARSTLLPGVVYHNQYIYTKPGQLATPSTNALVTSSTTPIFIANNSVHEYISQGVVTETVGIAGVANYYRLSAEAAASAARQEVARRGLVATVIGNYFGVLATERKFGVAQRSA
jgi:outer membrane protein